MAICSFSHSYTTGTEHDRDGGIASAMAEPLMTPHVHVAGPRMRLSTKSMHCTTRYVSP